MIIKVMTRKEPSFRQLLAYVDRDARDTRYVLAHNLLGHDLDTRAAEFEANAALLKKHQNGTVMFHDIVSITRSTRLGLERQKEILKDLVQAYIARRAPDHLIYAGLHDDHGKHLHYHLVISANPAGEWKRAHLSKPELRKLQADMEARVLALYPDLEQKPAMSAKAQRRDLSQPGHELKRRTGKLPERQRVIEALKSAFASAQSKDDLFRLLTEARLELYRRGKTIGVRDLDVGRNHRLSTLGLTDAFTALSGRIEAATPKTLSKHLNVQPAETMAAAHARPSPPQISSSPPAGPVVSTADPPSTQEEPVNILELAINGVVAIADALSVAPQSMKPVQAHVNSVRARVKKITRPGPRQKAPTLTPTSALAPTVQGSSPRAIPVETKAVRHAVNNSIDPDLTPDQVRVLNEVRQTMPPNEVQVLNEVRQALADERLREIAETRQQQDQQSQDQQGSRLKR